MHNSHKKKPLIQIRGLYKLFGKQPEKVMSRVHRGESKDQILADTGHTLGLRDINLDVKAGEIFVIMGLSGSGKFTLIRHFNRLIDPTEGEIRSEMQDQLIGLQSKLQKTIVFITHDLDEALRLGDRIAILKDGELVQQGAPEDILLNPATDYVEAFVKDVNRTRALTVETVMKPPACRITAETIDEALSQMKKTSEDFGYYVNDDGYQGIILQQTLEQAVQKGNHKKVTSILIETVPAIQADSILESVIPDTLDTDFPLPVVDDDGQLQGQLSRSSLAEVLGDVSIGINHQSGKRH